MYDDLADLYYKVNNYDKAIECLLNVENIRYKMRGRVDRRIIITYSRLASLYTRSKNRNEAIKYSKKLIDVCIKYQSTMKLGLIYARLGGLYSESGKYDEAKINYDKAESEILKRYGENHQKLIDVYYGLGLIYFNEKEINASVQYTEKSLNLGIKILKNDDPKVKRSNDLLLKLYDS